MLSFGALLCSSLIVGFFMPPFVSLRMVQVQRFYGNRHGRTSLADHGLLTGIEDITGKNSSFYTESLNVVAAKDEVLNTNFYSFFMQKLAEDCNGDIKVAEEKLTKIIAKAEEFCTSDEIWDRVEFFQTINNIIASKSNFVVVLGGKSTGKSALLSNIGQNSKHIVIYVDLRYYSKDIARSVVSAIGDSEFISTDIKTAAAKFFLKLFSRLPIATLPIFGLASLPKLDELLIGLDLFIEPAFSAKPPDTILADLLSSLTENDTKKVTLIVDEANLALTINEKTTVAELESVKSTLSKFVTLTKQRSSINVILVSSEHAFPFRLDNPLLEFNSVDINRFIFVGEIPPNKMYELLTTRWNMKEKLAKAMIDLYGGHIRDMYLALIELEEVKDNFRPFHNRLIARVKACLDGAEAAGIEESRLIEVFTSLATTGFAPLLAETESVAKYLSQNNVAGVVQPKSITIGLSRSVWEKHRCDFGLVPSSQSMRLVIASKLP